MREFDFELSVCAHLEAAGSRIVARQLGGTVGASTGRVYDVVVVEPGPTFHDRTALTERAIPSAVIESDLGPGRFRDWRSVLGSGMGAERAVDRACSIRFLERDRRQGREVVRQVDRYPDGWFDRIVAIENKPDLDNPGGLYDQLQYDVSLALVDEVVLVTASHVTRAHRHRLPDEVGIWRFDPAVMSMDVLVQPAALPVDRPGIERRHDDGDRTVIDIVAPDAKRRARRSLAERAYGKGWRTFTFPPCASIDPDGGPVPGLPMCTYKGRHVDTAVDCGTDCPGFRPSAPPVVDLAGERAARSLWVDDPPDRRRRQADLDRFG